LIFGSRCWIAGGEPFDVTKGSVARKFFSHQTVVRGALRRHNDRRVSDASLVGLGQRYESSRIMSAAAVVVVAAIILGTLYLGREVFVPIAMAILLSFVLAPLVGLLQRWRCPRAISAIGVVLIAFVSLFSLGGVVATQMAELAGDLPRSHRWR
jgi:AI-2E family transporter